MYEKIEKNENIIVQRKISLMCHFVDGAFAELKNAEEGKEYYCVFKDEFDTVLFDVMLKNNMWGKTSRKFFTNWNIEVYDGLQLVASHKFDCSNKRVYIALGSSSLGDTLAWFPMIDEFRKKHNCHVIVSTFLNDLFVDQYPELEFVKPGEVVNDIYAMYEVGWFYNENEQYDENRNPRDFKKLPLQLTATDILGIEQTEVRPRLKTIRNEILNFETYDKKWLEDLESEIFDFYEYNYGRVCIERGDVVVDLGANIGVFALYALHREASKVFCVEPYIPYVKTLLKNLNKFNSKVVISPIAISDVEGEVQINVNHENNTILSNVYEDYSWNETFNETDMVKTMRFDDYLDVNNIECVDFLKVDIEGSEYRLFKDISVETLQNRVNKIAIEYHWNYSEQLNIITDKLNEAGFEISTFESNSNARVGKLYAVNKRYEGKAVKRKVGIGVHSTCQSKYWNNPDGWQKVVDYLNENGFEVVLYSKEPSNYMGNVNPSNVTQFPEGSLQNVIDDLQKCEFFIGLGSGLSWLAWSVGIPVVLISGFSEEWAETKLNTHRIINKNVCHGCFNRHRLDPGDWNWCPEHKGTDRMFECTKTISADEVITKIKYLTRLV